MRSQIIIRWLTFQNAPQDEVTETPFAQENVDTATEEKCLPKDLKQSTQRDSNTTTGE
jgi:hypothetical protein